MLNELPTGTVTFLFTDIEGPTRLLHEPKCSSTSTSSSPRELEFMAAAEDGSVGETTAATQAA